MELTKEKNKNKELIFLTGEKPLAIIFSTLDKQIMYPFTTKNSEIFVFLEMRFYNEYPEYKEKENYFMANGIKINRFKNIKENGIKNGSSIVLNMID